MKSIHPYGVTPPFADASLDIYQRNLTDVLAQATDGADGLLLDKLPASMQPIMAAIDDTYSTSQGQKSRAPASEAARQVVSGIRELRNRDRGWLGLRLFGKNNGVVEPGEYRKVTTNNQLARALLRDAAVQLGMQIPRNYGPEALREDILQKMFGQAETIGVPVWPYQGGTDGSYIVHDWSGDAAASVRRRPNEFPVEFQPLANAIANRLRLCVVSAKDVASAIFSVQSDMLSECVSAMDLTADQVMNALFGPGLDVSWNNFPGSGAGWDLFGEQVNPGREGKVWTPATNLWEGKPAASLATVPAELRGILGVLCQIYAKAEISSDEAWAELQKIDPLVKKIGVDNPEAVTKLAAKSRMAAEVIAWAQTAHLAQAAAEHADDVTLAFRDLLKTRIQVV